MRHHQATERRIREAVSAAVRRFRESASAPLIDADNLPLTVREVMEESDDFGEGLAERLGLEPARKVTHRIDFGGDSWSAVSHAFTTQMASNPDLPIIMRLWLAALTKCWPGSPVAHFHVGELRDVLGGPGPDGQWQPLSEAGTSRALARAREAGLVEARSTVRKVWLSRDHAQRGGRAAV